MATLAHVAWKGLAPRAAAQLVQTFAALAQAFRLRDGAWSALLKVIVESRASKATDRPVDTKPIPPSETEGGHPKRQKQIPRHC